MPTPAADIRYGDAIAERSPDRSTPSTEVLQNSSARSRDLRTTASGDPRITPSPVPWHQSTLAIGLFGSLLMWAALPPLHWWLLGWMAPLPWLLLVLRPQLVGRRPGWTLYLISFAFWMGTVHWVRLPHWAANIGWVAMSGYLAVYPWAFLLLSRVAVHRLGLPIVVAAPLVWTGVEVARGYVLGGFTMSSLAHTQYRWLEWIQLADVIGCYGLGGLVMLVTACIARMIPWAGQRVALWPIVPLVLALVVPLGYGIWRTSGDHTQTGATIALIQGSIDTTFDDETDKDQRVMEQYAKLTKEAVDRRRNEQQQNANLSDIDLIVWPESMFRSPLVSFSADYQMPPEMKRRARNKTTEELEGQQRAALGKFFEPLHIPVLVGLGREHLTPERERRFNSAAFVDANGKITGTYDKMHLVMFGEYVPLFSFWPALYKLTPMGEGITAGDRAVAQEIDGVRLSPSICYETVIPHLIRKQIHQLRDEEGEPQVLVNLTNDGWFWGSSQLDLHLICGVFRTVECRKPLLIAANTGFSAWIDAEGRIIEQGPRRATGIILADVEIDDRCSFFLEYGGWLELLYVVPCAVLAVIAMGDWLRGRIAARRRTSASASL